MFGCATQDFSACPAGMLQPALGLATVVVLMPPAPATLIPAAPAVAAEPLAPPALVPPALMPPALLPACAPPDCPPLGAPAAVAPATDDAPLVPELWPPALAPALVEAPASPLVEVASLLQPSATLAQPASTQISEPSLEYRAMALPPQIRRAVAEGGSGARALLSISSSGGLGSGSRFFSPQTRTLKTGCGSRLVVRNLRSSTRDALS
jgi:hypothetical protein